MTLDDEIPSPPIETDRVPEEICAGIFSLEKEYDLVAGMSSPAKQRLFKTGYLVDSKTFSKGSKSRMESMPDDTDSWNVNVKRIVADPDGSYLLMTGSSIYRLRKVSDERPVDAPAASETTQIIQRPVLPAKAESVEQPRETYVQIFKRLLGFGKKD